jgi:hypothetical protein
MVVQATTLGKQRQEDRELENGLGYIVRSCLKKKKKVVDAPQGGNASCI